MKPRMIIPMLVCADAAKEIEFCKTAFGAVELSRHAAPDGRVVHATLSFFDSLFMVHDDWPGLGSRPAADGSSSVVNYLYCDDTDVTMAKAVAAGARVLMPAADQPWGDRIGRIIDQANHVWNVASRVA